jgi:hypothetical protein
MELFSIPSILINDMVRTQARDNFTFCLTGVDYAKKWNVF